ncbi:MAG: hypothetical protein ACK4ND_15915, partial [Cytophagaceae bacterium]
MTIRQALILPLLFLALSCNKNEEEQVPEVNFNTAACAFLGEFDNEEIIIYGGGRQLYDCQMFVHETESRRVYVGTIDKSTDSDGIKIVFHDHTTEEGKIPTNSQFLALFEKGDVAFHTGTETGVKIAYTDKNLVEWSSGVPVEGVVFK